MIVSCAARIAGIALLGLVGGCTLLDKDIGPLLAAEELNLTVGTSDVGDVLEALGPPAKVSALPGGFALLYEQLDIREKQIGLSFNAKFLQWFKLAYGWSKARYETLVLTFNEMGTVRGFALETRDERVGSGLAFQLIVTVAGVVDTSALERNADPHTWGMWCLSDLPETLNRAQSLETGAVGISQIGESANAGQYTLELRMDEDR